MDVLIQIIRQMVLVGAMDTSNEWHTSGRMTVGIDNRLTDSSVICSDIHMVIVRIARQFLEVPWHHCAAGNRQTHRGSLLNLYR